ncbi:MAG TPA: DedA family protein [Gemmatimonadales bacterium]|jgi:membrane protein DedA with SNARE-associated domain|nr:DedA family protein [Gemmatimonadales bacterium]
MGLQQLIIRHGLLAVFIGSAFEGDFTLILAGVVSHLGFFPFPLAVAVGALGSFLGDSIWYVLGRFRGPRFRAGRLYRRVGPRIQRLADRFGPWQLILSRFVYGSKAASMVFWGLHDLKFRRFGPIDGIGCVLGSAVFTGLGYVVSGSATLLLGRVRRVQLWLLGAVLAGAVLVLIIHLTAKRELHLEEMEPADE